MSGTSLDGLDVALCRISGAGRATQVHLEAFHCEPYDETFRQKIQSVFAQNTIDFPHLTILNVEIAEYHAAIVLQCLQRWGRNAGDIDLIASHGQTVCHAPARLHRQPGRPNATLQIGDGDHLARRTGIPTISDFRQKHLAAGGEGAPLALYGDYFLFGSPDENRLLLNMGGIANFTWLPATGNAAEVFATDTGPGNTLIDAFARRLFGVSFDRDALLARAGIPDEALLRLLLETPFFGENFPKTTGPELFNTDWVDAALRQLPKGSPAHNPYNLIHTLTLLTAESIAAAIRRTAGGLPAHVYAGGGGARNPMIMERLRQALPEMSIDTMDALGVPGDAKEAILFAVLANECVAGGAISAVLGGAPMVSMGKISLPG